MEAATLQKKKTTISKGKLKKSIKNVLCRPDQLFWPEVTADEGKRLESALKRHKINIPEFKKPHWKDLKLIPKAQRPKPPKLKKVDGLLLGVRECSESIHKGECSAVIIEAKVSPRLVVHPVIEICVAKDIPLLCMTDLRNVTAKAFGVPTSCLGIKCDCLPDIRKEIVDIVKNYPRPKHTIQHQLKQPINKKVEKMDVEENIEKTDSKMVETFPFLYRTNKKSRVFVPNAQDNVLKPKQKFVGQDFIEFSEKPDQKDSKAYMKMILKRISNNPERVKKK